ncbi:MAG TPA: tetratricopeptide repeat protein [Pirellulales bacterium]|nr:tetratricopeptide repeat protein [Pirellulales bacterium]
MSKSTRMPLLHALYHQYLVDQDADGFSLRVAKRYSVGTLGRVAEAGDRMARRAAVLAIGLLADYETNATLGRALHDRDRGVRILAENGIRALWCRIGNRRQRKHLDRVIELNAAHRFKDAVELATRLIDEAAWLAEGWNQRALALFNLGRFAESIHDCNQALEINPYHFGAAAGMAQCHMQLKDRISALECFQRALRLNPNLEGVRAHVLYLQRALKSKE